MIRVGYVPMGKSESSPMETILNDFPDEMGECVFTLCMVHFLHGARFIAIGMGYEGKDETLWYWYRSSWES